MKFSALFRLLFLTLCCWVQAGVAAETNDVPRYRVEGYVVSDTTLGAPTNAEPMLSSHTGANVTLHEIVRAAAELQAEYARNGRPAVSIGIGAQDLTNGVITMHVFQSAVPQIRIAGQRYVCSSNEVSEASNLIPAVTNVPVAVAPPVEKTPAKPVKPPRPPTPEEEALRQKMAEMDLAEREAKYPQPPLTTQLISAPVKSAETNTMELALRARQDELDEQARRTELLPPQTNSVVSTNGPFFEVKGYELTGNTLLPANLTQLVLQPYIGTNINFEKIRSALTDLQAVYRERGFATVSVTLPQQTLSDKIVKIRVFEGRLEDIQIVNNNWFSSNNIMRALPSLHPNMILTAPIFQTELDRANGNQDRQIYPSIEPGIIEGTTMLKLDVKDRFPLHAKTELNNENSPGTPELRVNSSAEYKNLWEMEHSLGVQYSFSPEAYKQGSQWNGYDEPLVANYSAFYRMPLGNPEAVANTINGSTRFGYDEATRKFNLPPPSGQPELNIYASRSAIDTGLETSPEDVIFNVPGVRKVTRQDVQQDITVNNAVGAQLTAPVPDSDASNIHSTWSAALNFKTYHLMSAKTNTFRFTEITINPNGTANPPIVSTVSSPVPLTVRSLEYLPLTLRYDGSETDARGATSFGLGLTANTWFSGSLAGLHGVTGSTNSNGHWITLNPTVTRDIFLPKNWTLSLHGEAQWASEPLVSNEQFGSGGVNSVRGYHEGEVFGDEGWRVNTELKTPIHVAGMVYGKQPLTLRGSIYMDYSDVYLLDPQGRAGELPLWSAGVGCVAAIGTHWETRFLFSVPFDRSPTLAPMRPRFNFSLIGQF